MWRSARATKARSTRRSRRSKQKGVKASGGAVDVADTKALRAWVGEAAEALGGLDIFVANVSALAHGHGRGILAAQPRDRHHGHGVRHRGGVAGAREIGRPARSSSSARPALVEIAGPTRPYASVKAALVPYVKALARNLAAKNIRANMVSPGNVYFKGGVWDVARESTTRRCSRRCWRATRWAAWERPQEVANAVGVPRQPARQLHHRHQPDRRRRAHATHSVLRRCREFRFLRRSEIAARSGAQVPARAQRAGRRAARHRRRRLLRQGAVARDRRHGLARRRDSRGIRRRRAWAISASACSPRSWAARWRRCRSPPPSISRPRRCCVAGSEAQKQTLPAEARFRRGDRHAWRSPKVPGQPTPRRCAPASRRQLSGTKLPVPDGDIADLAIVAARGERPAERGSRCSWSISPASGVHARDGRDARSQPRACAARLRRRAGRAAGAAGRGLPLLRRVLDRAAVLFAFEQVGGARALPGDGARPTRWSATPSAGRSARSRRSSTSSPTSMSRSSWRAPTPITAPGR